MEKINYYQLAIMLFLVRVFRAMTYNPVSHFNSVQVMLSLLITGIVQYVLLLPIFYIYKKYPGKGVSEVAFEISKVFGIIVNLIYAVFFVLSSLKIIKYFVVFMSESFPEIANRSFIIITIIVVSGYAAASGIEAMGRCSLFIVAAFLFMLIIMTLTCQNAFEIKNINLVDNNSDTLISAVIREIGMNIDIAIIGLLLPYLKSNIVKAAVWLCSLKTVIMILVVFLYTSFLGEYVKFVRHPFFALGEYSKTKFVERFNGIYMLEWVLCAVIAIGINIFTVSLCLQNVFVKLKKWMPSIFVSGVCMVVSLGYNLQKNKRDDYIDNNIIYIYVILLTFVLPLIILLILSFAKNRKTKSKNIKKLAAFIVVIMATLTLSGCRSHTVQINKRAVVELVGVDKISSENLKVTLQIYSPDGDITETAGNAKISVVQGDGNTITQCLSQIEQKLGKSLFFGHNRILIIGKDMVDNNLYNTLSCYSNDVIVYPGTDIIMAENNAFDIIKMQLKTGIITSDSMYNVLEKAAENGFAKRIYLSDIITKLNSESDVAVLPIFSVVVNELDSDSKTNEDGESTSTDPKMLNVSKNVIINKNGIITDLDSNQTAGIKFLTNTLVKSVVTVNMENKDVSVQINDSKTSVKTIEKDNHVVLQVSIKANAKPLDLNYRLLNVDHADNKRIKRLAADKIMNQCKDAITIANDYSCDIIGIKKNLKYYNYKYYESIKDDITNVIDNMEVDITINLNTVL